jgi:TolA-binding protein
VESPAGPQPHGETRDTAASEAQSATRGELRALRRWTLVATVWAAAATAVAIVALVDRGGEAGTDRSASLATQISRVQRVTDRRIDELESRLDDLARGEDVTKLDQRLREVEDDASRAASDAKAARDTATDLEQRVEDLERAGDPPPDNRQP